MKKFIFVAKYICQIRSSVREYENGDYAKREEIGTANAKIVEEYEKLFGEVENDIDFAKLFFTNREIKRMLDNGTL